MLTQLVKYAPHEWSYIGDHQELGRHSCYFCHPEDFPDMPDFHTLCARCGAVIKTDRLDKMNDAMAVCPECEEDLALDEW